MTQVCPLPNHLRFLVFFNERKTCCASAVLLGIARTPQRATVSVRCVARWTPCGLTSRKRWSMPEHRTPPEYPIPPLALETSRWRNLATPPLLPDTPFLLQCIEKKLNTAPYLKTCTVWSPTYFAGHDGRQDGEAKEGCLRPSRGKAVRRTHRRPQHAKAVSALRFSCTRCRIKSVCPCNSEH